MDFDLDLEYMVKDGSSSSLETTKTERWCDLGTIHLIDAALVFLLLGEISATIILSAANEGCMTAFIWPSFISVGLCLQWFIGLQPRMQHRTGDTVLAIDVLIYIVGKLVSYFAIAVGLYKTIKAGGNGFSLPDNPQYDGCEEPSIIYAISLMLTAFTFSITLVSIIFNHEVFTTLFSNPHTKRYGKFL